MSDVNSTKVVLHEDGQACEIHGKPGEYIYNLIRDSSDFYEASLLRAIHTVYPDEGEATVVDVGANIGNHTVYFAKVIGSPVLAIEPVESNLIALRKNVKANKLEDLVEIAPVAAWNVNETLTLEQNVKNNSGTFQVTADGSFTAQGQRIDDLVGNRNVSLIKIDVEGAEEQALTGALKTVERHRPMLIIETHSAKATQQHRKLLEPLNYHLVGILGRSDNYIWVASSDEANRIRAEITVLSHRREQRKLNASFSRQVDATSSLQVDVTELKQAAAKIEQADTSYHEDQLDILGSFKDKLDDVQEIVKEISHIFPNLSLQHTQLAVEIGKNSASTEYNTTELRRFLEHVTEEISSFRGMTEEQQRANEQLKQVREQLEKSREHQDAISSIASTLDSMNSSIEETYIQSDDRFKLLEKHTAEISNSIRAVYPRITAPQGLPRTEDSPRADTAYLPWMHEELNHQVHELDKLLSGLTEDGADTVADEMADLLRSWASSVQETVKKFTAFATSQNGLEPHGLSDTQYLIRQRDNLLRAYQELSRRFESERPDAWDSASATRALDKIYDHNDPVTRNDDQNHSPKTPAPWDINLLQTSEPPKLLPRSAPKYRQRVRVGVASMPGREKTLAQVLHRIAPQADEVFVYLNNMESAPIECTTVPDNVQFFTGPDLGDRGKFRFLDGFTGYYLTVDDDIDYSRYHVISLLQGIERYGRRAIVGWHGSIFRRPFESFYRSDSRQVLSFRSLRGQDTPVHLLGTGVCGFHTDTINLSLVDFKAPNMADVYLAIQAKKQMIKMMVLAHEGGEAVPLETIGSISDASLGKKDHSKKTLDVRLSVTQLVQANSPWPQLERPMKPNKPGMRVAIVGRTNPDRWKKGGILKSCLLTRQMLLPYGCQVHMADIMDGDPIGLEGFQPDVVMVYVGDPERPDFKEVHRIVEHHADRGIPVLVNLSEDSHPNRTDAIGKVMERWGERYKGVVKMMAFTPSVQNEQRYRKFAENIVTIPKTLTYAHQASAEFETTSGIFIGDVAKLSDSRLVGPDLQTYINALKQAVPESRIYAVRQYKPRFEIPDGIDEIWPHISAGELAQRLTNMRLAINFVRYATYEMVPVEAAALGVPILHPNMPQSLNTALGLAAVQFRHPHDLAESAGLLYRDPILWRQYSQASQKMSQAQDFDIASAQMYMSLRKIVSEDSPKIGAKNEL